MRCARTGQLLTKAYALSLLANLLSRSSDQGSFSLTTRALASMVKRKPSTNGRISFQRETTVDIEQAELNLDLAPTGSGPQLLGVPLDRQPDFDVEKRRVSFVG